MESNKNYVCEWAILNKVVKNIKEMSNWIESVVYKEGLKFNDLFNNNNDWQIIKVFIHTIFKDIIM